MVITANPPKFDKRQPSRGDYDAIVYIEGSHIIAEDSNGRKIASGVAGTDDVAVCFAARDYASAISNSVLIMSPGTYYMDSQFGFNSISDMSIFGSQAILDFDGMPTTGGTDDHALYLSGCENIEIHDITIKNSKRNGILAWGNNILIKNVDVYNSYYQGINVQGDDIRILDSTIDTVTTQFGVVLGDVRRCCVVGNTVKSTAMGGIEWGYSGEDVLVSENHLTNCATGVQVLSKNQLYEYTKNCTISNNIIRSSSVVGIEVARKNTAGVSHICHDIFAFGNQVIDCAAGIKIYDQAAVMDKLYNVFIRDNTVVGTTNSMLAVLNGYEIYAEDNKFLGNLSGYGIDIRSTGFVAFNRNTIKNVASAGIYLTQDLKHFEDNYIDGTGFVATGDGIYLPASNTFVDTSIIRNVFRNIQRDPIRSLSIGCYPITRSNIGYVTPGEVRTASGLLAAGVANAIAFAWHNPELQDILVKKVTIRITTPGGTAGSLLDVGIADDAAGTNRGTEFFNDIDLNAAAIVKSTVSPPGTQTVEVFCQDSVSATDGWIVGKILTANAAALVGSYYIEYEGA